MTFNTLPFLDLPLIVLALLKDPTLDCKACVIGQHMGMLYQVLNVFFGGRTHATRSEVGRTYFTCSRSDWRISRAGEYGCCDDTGA